MLEEAYCDIEDSQDKNAYPSHEIKDKEFPGSDLEIDVCRW